LVAFVGMVATNAFAQAGNVLESISTSTLQGGKVLIRANFKDALASAPPGFAVTNPARIAIDLPGVSNGLGKNTVEVAEGDVRSVSVAEGSGRTRLVVNLARSLNYSTALDGKALIVTVDAGVQSALKDAQPVTKFAEAVASTAQRHGVRDIDFRRGLSGEGRVIVDLSSASTGIDIRRQGTSVIVDLINTWCAALMWAILRHQSNMWMSSIKAQIRAWSLSPRDFGNIRHIRRTRNLLLRSSR
jgi:type IV pilus assembly protein PilQ